MRFDKELLADLLKAFPQWGLSPEKFMEFIIMAVEVTARQSETSHVLPRARRAAERQLANAFLRAFKLELFPYKGLDDLYSKAGPFIDVDRSISLVRNRIEQEEAVWEICEGQQLLPSQETAMEGALEDWVAREVVNKLAPFLDDEEET